MLRSTPTAGLRLPDAAGGACCCTYSRPFDPLAARGTLTQGALLISKGCERGGTRRARHAFSLYPGVPRAAKGTGRVQVRSRAKKSKVCDRDHIRSLFAAIFCRRRLTSDPEVQGKTMRYAIPLQWIKDAEERRLALIAHSARGRRLVKDEHEPDYEAHARTWVSAVAARIAAQRVKLSLLSRTRWI